MSANGKPIAAIRMYSTARSPVRCAPPMSETATTASTRYVLRFGRVDRTLHGFLMFSFLGLSAQDFIGILKANGIRVNPVLENTSNPGNFLASTSDTFRITATGRAGRIEKTLTAVVRYDDLLGKLLYWKED